MLAGSRKLPCSCLLLQLQAWGLLLVAQQAQHKACQLPIQGARPAPCACVSMNHFHFDTLDPRSLHYLTRARLGQSGVHP